MSRFTILAVAVASGLLLGPFVFHQEVQAQKCTATCSSADCPSGEQRGIGNAIGVYDRKQCVPGCLVPCEPDAIEGGEGIGFASMMQILDDLKAARTQEDFARVTMAYRERLLLNASRSMVLALDGCSGGPLVPVSMVLLSPDQVDTMQKLKIQSLEGYLAASSG